MGDASRPRPVGDVQHIPNFERNDDYDPTKTPQYGASPANIPQQNYPYMNQYPQHQGSPARQDAFNMNTLGGALPPYQEYSNSAQRFHPGSSPSGMGYQMQTTQQYSSSMGHSGSNSPYANAFSGQYQGQYAPAHTPSPQNLQHSGHTAGPLYQSGFVGQPHQQGHQFFMQQNQYMPQSPIFPVMPGAIPYGGRGNFPIDTRMQPQHRGRDYSVMGSNLGVSGRSSSIASSSSVVRGPPRKPRQSGILHPSRVGHLQKLTVAGHAIWIGNLPPQTDLMSLVLHVCKETKGLESLFLISKSNCAFANFKDEEACATAQAKVHDSRFQTVRLVSRLRRNSVGAAGVSVPTGPSEPAISSNSAIPSSPSTKLELEEKPKEDNGAVQAPHATEDEALQKDKFFIVKSLTVEDLELSMRNGIWATQSHNEEAFNKAYESTENVYLIFSANKSGEYFGYAKMISPINDDPAAAIEFAPKAQAVEDPELPKAISTAATEFAPKGRIIDDSARGTIFWEAERIESDEADGADEEEDESNNRSDQDGSPPPTKAWGKPFKVEWISTTRLPFYRTRGLRNPWNSNREVKIARDGTELETAIGKRLVGLFHRVPSPVAPLMSNLQMIGGYSPQTRFQ